MYRLFKSEVGRGITGIIVSIILVLAALFPIFFMELLSQLVSLT